MESQKQAKKLLDALVYPIIINDDLDWNLIDENTKLNDITSVKVLKEFEDDHAECYLVEMVVKGETHTYADNWAGHRAAKMYYQSELSQDIRDAVLKPYLLNKILDCTF
jgi:hypothetical protein